MIKRNWTLSYCLRLTARFFCIKNFNWKIKSLQNWMQFSCEFSASKYLKKQRYMLYKKSIEGGARCSIWQKSLTDCSTRHDLRFWLYFAYIPTVILIYSSDDCYGEASNYVMILDTNIWKCELTRISARWEKDKTEYVFVLLTAFFILCGFRWLEINVIDHWSI